MTSINMLPQTHQPYTDKYFLRTNKILIAENLNPEVTMKVFCRTYGRLSDEQYQEAINVIKAFSKETEIWLPKNNTFTEKSPILVLRGPIQDFVELETIYLGVLSHHISQNNSSPLPNFKEVEEKFRALRRIYGKKVNLVYFGARHYHWSLDRFIAQAALRGGANQTSTDIGSSFIQERGIGTMPHVLPIIMAWTYGIENATFEATRAFNNHMPDSVPRTVLVDTFNREITDTLKAVEYLKVNAPNCPIAVRLDTCGENYGETCNTNSPPSSYPFGGKGVTIELARKVKMSLIENGYKDVELFLTSGMGNVRNATDFNQANVDFKSNTGYSLFTGMGVGEVINGKFCTADIVEVEHKPLSKSGRSDTIDFNNLSRV